MIGKKEIKCILFIIFLISVLTFAISCQNQSNTNSDYTLPETREIEVGRLYEPDFKLKNGVVVESVSLNIPVGSNTELDGIKFTPDVIGVYEYLIKFNTKDNSIAEVVSFTAVDTTAPVFESLENRTAETGFYVNLSEDIAKAKVTDNCATTLSIYAKSITYNDIVTNIDMEAISVFLPEPGEYIVTLVAEDFSGNKSEATYKITAGDTKAPIIEAPKTYIAWVDSNGKVTLPIVNIVEVGSYILDVTVKKELVDIPIIDGKIAASNGIYTLSYMAVDFAENKSELTVNLEVKESGIINDFTNPDEIDLWNSTAVREQNNRMYIFSSKNSVDIEFFNYFLTSDWSDFSTFSMTVTNNRAVELIVKANIRVDGKWLEIAPMDIAGGTIGQDLANININTQFYKFSLSQYSIEKAEGIRLSFACRGGVDAAIDKIELTNEEISSPIPQVSGTLSGKFELDSKGYTEITVNQKINPQSNQNAITFNLYSSAKAEIRIGLKFQDKTIFTRRTFQAGENLITRLPNLEVSENIMSTGFYGFEIYNEENYPIKIAISNYQMETVTSLAQNQYAYMNKTYGISYSESFEIPNPFFVNDKYFSNLSISIVNSPDNNNTFENTGYSIGSVIASTGTNALAAGKYIIRYQYKDALSVSKTLEYSLIVAKKVLSVDIELKAMFMTDNEMPMPSLSSAVYDQQLLDTAEIEIYWRERGRLTWNTLDSNIFTPEKSKWYEFRYVTDLEVDGTIIHKELFIEKFMHTNTYTMDFEAESDVGNDAYLNNEPFRSRYMYDGGYYNPGPNKERPVFEVSQDWSVSGDTSVYCKTPNFGYIGWLVNPAIVNFIDINAVCFWAKAEASYASTMDIGRGSGWQSSEDFEFKMGVHQYTIFLKEPVNLQKVTAVTFLLQANVGIYIDDFEFINVNRLSMSEEVYEDTYDISKAYEVKRPTLSSDIFTSAELDAAVWELKYEINGESGVVEPVDGVYSLLFPQKGTYKITWKATVGNRSVQYITTIVAGEIRLSADLPVSGLVGQEIILDVPTAEIDIDSYVLEYRHEDDYDWSEATGTAFTPQKAGMYLIRFTTISTIDAIEIEGVFTDYIWVRKNLFTADFEPIEGSEYHLGASNVAYGAYDPVTGNVTNPNVPIGTTGVMVDSTHAHSGDYSMRVVIYGDRGVGFANMIMPVPEQQYTGITFWAYSDYALSNLELWLCQWKGVSPRRAATTEKFSLQVGWNEITLNFTKPVTMSNIDTIELEFNVAAAGKVLWFDDFMLIGKDDLKITEKEYEDIFDLSEAYIVERPALTSNIFSQAELEHVAWTLTYSKGNLFDTIEPVNGVYSILFEERGVYTFTWMAVFGVYTAEYSTTLNVNSAQMTIQLPKSGLLGQQLNFGVPNLNVTMNSYTISYKLKGENNWTQMNGTSFVPDAVGTYSILYTAKYNDIGDVEATITAEGTVYVRADPYTADFEPIEGSEYHLGASNVAYGAYDPVTGNVTNPNVPIGTTGVMVDSTHAHSGDYSMRVVVHGDRGVGFANVIMPVPEQQYTGITFWVYSDYNLSNLELWLCQWKGVSPRRAATTEKFSLQVGWNQNNP